MILQEVFKELELKGSYEEQCKQYALMLDTGNVLEVFPEELAGDDTSPDGKWSWPKKAGFINKYKNNVDFHDITCIFEEPLPNGVFIINKHFDKSSTFKERDRVLARIGKKRFVDVRVNYEFNEILLAKEVSRQQVDREISHLIIHSADWYFKPFIEMYKTEYGSKYLETTSYYIFSWLSFYRGYLDRKHDDNNRELYTMMLIYYLGLSLNEAEWFIDKWDEDWESEEDFRKMESEEKKW